MEANEKYKSLEEELRLHTHAYNLMESCADDPDSPAMMEQRNRLLDFSTRMGLVRF